MSLLKRSEPRADQPRIVAFKGVVKTRGRFRAKAPGGCDIGMYDTVDEAASAVADRIGVPRARLWRKRSDSVDLDDHVSRVNAMMDIYRDADGSCAAMSDLSASTDAMHEWPLLPVCAPALFYASVLGKFGPWKRALGVAFSVQF